MALLINNFGLNEGVVSLDPNLTPIVVALISVVSAILLAFMRAAAILLNVKRERERELFGKAYRAAMAWREMVYRLRRRAHTDASERLLIERFHELQEEIDYYMGWTASEGRWIGRSYCRLVKDVKARTELMVQKAWAEKDQRPVTEAVRKEDEHPDVHAASDRFLKDVRKHLSFWVVPKVGVVWRNRGGAP